MFKISQKGAVDRPFLNCDYIRCTPSSLNLVHGENKQIFLDIPRDDSAITLEKVILN